MSKVTLATLVDAANKKYSDFELELDGGVTATFVPALRLPKEKRVALREALNAEARGNADPDAEMVDLYKDTFKVSEKFEGDFDKLDAAVGDVPATWEMLFEKFLTDTESGEV